ncbi:hypothetical protein IFM89_002541 [Coptis chinensis]|uniref:Ubiquitin-like protease family profile domain-containing protein n=1 Tax=Coptis chinensis TaxID=261450 RepID=A0A835LLJ0_9MAGN|nr:hypothetical protein IFM89_002541 [Coptis chinensis]
MDIASRKIGKNHRNKVDAVMQNVRRRTSNRIGDRRTRTRSSSSIHILNEDDDNDDNEVKANGEVDNPVYVQRGKLGSNQFDDYFEKMWKTFPTERRNNFTYFGCLWFDLYQKQGLKEKVLNWIKKKNIRSTKYVFVPIVCWGHWRLLILCNFGECLLPNCKRQCMLLLDSLAEADPKKLEPTIRKFITDIYIGEGMARTEVSGAKIPFVVPKVPQQKNDEDCGIYVLYYIYLFMESAPEDFNISEGYPYFMKENWFNIEGLESFRKDFCTSTALMGFEEDIMEVVASSSSKETRSAEGASQIQCSCRVSEKGECSFEIVLEIENGDKGADNVFFVDERLNIILKDDTLEGFLSDPEQGDTVRAKGNDATSLSGHVY